MHARGYYINVLTPQSTVSCAPFWIEPPCTVVSQKLHGGVGGAVGMDGAFLLSRALVRATGSETSAAKPASDLPPWAVRRKRRMTGSVDTWKPEPKKPKAARIPSSSKATPPSRPSGAVQTRPSFALSLDHGKNHSAMAKLPAGKRAWPTGKFDTVAAADQADKDRAVDGIMNVARFLETRGATLKVRELASSDDVLRILVAPKKPKTVLHHIRCSTAC